MKSAHLVNTVQEMDRLLTQHLAYLVIIVTLTSLMPTLREVIVMDLLKENVQLVATVKQDQLFLKDVLLVNTEKSLHLQLELVCHHLVEIANLVNTVTNMASF